MNAILNTVHCALRERMCFFALPALLLCNFGYAAEQKLLPSTPGLFFGAGLTVSDGRLFVGSTQGYSPVSSNGSSGYVDVYARQPSAWVYTSTVTAFDLGPFFPNGSDMFGNVVAAEGDWLAVAGHVASSDVESVYTYHFVNGSWIPFQRLDRGTSGNSVYEALVLHSGHLLVGETVYDLEGDVQDGHVYAYELSGSSFVSLGELARPLSQSGDYFARTLSFVGDRLVTSAPFYIDQSGKRGLVFTYVFTAGQWVHLALLQPDSQSLLSFGYGVAGCMHGGQLAVTVPNAFGSAGSQVGFVATYARTETGWQELSPVHPSDSSPPTAFGSSVACDDDVLAVSAHGSNRAFRFLFNQGAWQQDSVLSSSDPGNNGFFGPIAVSARDVVVSDARQGSPIPSGAVYAFNDDTLFANGFE
jgi:hypothetical protein